MGPIDRRTFLRGAAAIAGASFLPLELARGDDPPGGYDVSEWGVFVLAGDLPSGRAADLEGDFPEFVYAARRDRTRFLKAVHEAEQAPIIVTKPVVWFRGTAPGRIAMSVGLPGGKPLVWWPAARVEGQGLAWDVELVPAETPPTKVAPEGHWWNRLRESDACAVRIGDTVERFVYYDGETRIVDRLSVRQDGSALVVANGYPHAVHDVVFAWNPRGPEGPRHLGVVGAIGAGAQVRVGLEPRGGPLVEDGAAELVRALESAGMPPSDRDAFVAVWKGEFFGRAGLTVAFRLPTEVYDDLLPLTLDPPPRSRVRIGWCLAVDRDPDLAERVRELVEALGSDEWTARQDAFASLSRLGVTALPALREAIAHGQDAHVMNEARRLVELIESRYSTEDVPAALMPAYDEWKRYGRIVPPEWRHRVR